MKRQTIQRSVLSLVLGAVAMGFHPAQADETSEECSGQTATILHQRGGGNAPIVIEVCTPALPAHLAHGDALWLDDQNEPLPIPKPNPRPGEETPVSFVDNDGDGYFVAYDNQGQLIEAVSSDCDDNNDAVNPGAREIFDNYWTDENCDGRPQQLYQQVTIRGQSYMVLGPIDIAPSPFFGTEIHPQTGMTMVVWETGANTSGDVPGLTNYLYPSSAAQDFEGESNTAVLMAAAAQNPGDYFPAAMVCDGLVDNGLSDWYLPAAGELKELADQHLLPRIESAGAPSYWSSSELNYISAWGVVDSVSSDGNSELVYLQNDGKGNFDHVVCLHKM